MSSMKFLVADDHYITRMGVKFLLKEIFPNSKIEEAKDADEVLKQVRSLDFDLIILDLNMPKTNGVDLIGRILRLKPEVKILVLSMNNESIYSTKAIEEGAKGFVSKEEDMGKLKDAISKVLSDRIYLSDSVINTLIERKQTKNYTENPFSILSSKELEIARLIYEGKSLKDMLALLKKSQSTISTQKANIFSKLGVETQNEFLDMARLYKLSEFA
ncbi:MAG: hypothetical protein CFE21_02580 [Bacteroidetes bacterium B1(2017)]|nr:MAG: hypothetical protein CFE21_02580 [Bacteroidetes bacterium B1(2017)]